MSSTKTIISNHIGHGKGEAISRNTLSILAGVTESHVAKIVREMKYRDHELICEFNSDINVYYYRPQSVDEAMDALKCLMEKEKNILEYIHIIQSFIEQKTEGVINFNNLPDIDYERDKKSTEEIF